MHEERSAVGCGVCIVGIFFFLFTNLIIVNFRQLNLLTTYRYGPYWQYIMCSIYLVR